jgi:hypothetical protein
MCKAAICWVMLAGLTALQAAGNDFGEEVRCSLERSRLLYPAAAQPDSALSRAILARIEWLNQNNRAFFSHGDWPMRVTAAEALALGIRPVGASRTTAPPKPSGRYLAVVTKNFSVVGASFRKGQQIVLESLEDYGKRATTVVDGQLVVLWLDHIKIVRDLPSGEAALVVVKVDSARYGFPGTTAYSVAGMVQSLIAPDVSGKYEILVSDALLTPGAAQRMNRRVVTGPPFDPNTGQPNPRPYKILTVTYTLNGLTKTKQGIEGRVLTLD